MKRYYLDARELEYPKPLERAIGFLRKLDTESYLYMVHRRYPTPLVALCDEHGLKHRELERGGVWHIVITPSEETDPGSIIEKEGI